MSNSAGNDNDIAIVGMALRVPGANNLDDFWRNLRQGVESIRTYSDDELKAAHVAPELLSHPNYVKRGAPLADMEFFDPEFFGFSPKEAAILDPQHRHFFETAWEALEDGGLVPENIKGRVGVYAGCGANTYFMFNLLSNPQLVESVGYFLLRHTGNDKDFLATRLSYVLDLKGPSVNVQTACSTGLVAVHIACQNLLSGECDVALAGGSTIDQPHHRGYLYVENEILSPDGHCRAFDHRSKGTVFGSGSAVVVLRRLADAVADNDRIYAVIKGSAINNDGAGKVSYLAPSVPGQAAAVSEAIAIANVPAESIEFVETHGTGTPMGDPIEISALTQAFRETTEKVGFCAIASVKSNLGHLDTAAGTVSLIKAALALHHGEIPASICFEAPNPLIDFAESPFFVNTELRPWPPRPGSPRRAGVNSLGVGGTNAHLILEEAPPRVRATPARRGQQVLQLSARNRAALDQACARLAQHLRDNPGQDLADVAYTLRVGRRAFDQRRVLAARDRDEAIRLLEERDPQRVFTHSVTATPAWPVFMFPGGGAQYVRMGAGLYASEPLYKEQIDNGLAWFRKRTGHDLRPFMFAADPDLAAASTEFERPSLQLPAIFIVEHALARLWMSRGLEPQAFIGHSMGENTAACLASVMSYEDALGLVALRGQLFERVPEGGMLSIPLTESEILPLLGPELDLATVNGPQLCTVSGPRAALDRLAKTLAAREVEFSRIKISIAAHSRMLEPILGEFRAYLRRIPLRPPRVPFISNRTGTWITKEQATSPDYWVEHLRNPVLFSQGVRTLLGQPGVVFIEVGPGKTLGSLVRQHSDVAAQVATIASLRHPEEKVDDDAYFATALGRVWAVGGAVQVDPIGQGEVRQRVALPAYAFQHQRYWYDPGRPETKAPAAGNLEKIAQIEDWFSAPVWRRRAARRATQALPASTWLVFLDEAGVGARLVDRLRGRGDEVFTVRVGDTFYKVNEHAYTLAPEHGRQGYDQLIRELSARGKLPNRVIHLWMVTTDESFRPGSSLFHRWQEHGFYSLLSLAQAFGSESAPPFHLLVISSGMQQVDRERLPYPEKATVLGPAKVIPREFPGTTCTSIDVALDGGAGWFGRGRQSHELDTICRQLLVEIDAPPANGVLAYRQGRRFELGHEACPPDWSQRDESEKGRIKPGGVYLITGGLGGIGLALADELARKYRPRLALLGRSPLPKRTSWDMWLAQHSASDATSKRIRKVQALEEKGAEVLVLAADVTDGESVRAALKEVKQRFGTIDGVLHAAGVLKDELIPLKDRVAIDAVFAPKLHGTRVLAEALADVDLDFFALFSSVSTAVGPAGQVDYVAANAYLNAFAQSRSRSPRSRTVAVNWGIWNQVGMAAEAAATSRTSPTTHPVSHPLFATRTSFPGGEQVLKASFSPSTHWVLDEHRTRAGDALFPGTGYLELARAALAECGFIGTCEIQDFLFLRPLWVPDAAPKEVRVILRPEEGGHALRVQSQRMLEDGRIGWETHAEASLRSIPGLAPELPSRASIEARCPDKTIAKGVEGIRSTQEEHLVFGPRWRVLQQVSFGKGEALAGLELPASFVDDLEHYALHPGMLDFATGYALDLIAGYRPSDGVWVPVRYGRVQVHRPLAPRVWSWVRSHGDNRADKDVAVFDVDVFDDAGRLLVSVEEFALKHLKADSAFAVLPAPSAAQLELETADATVSERLSPAEKALHHNLARGILPEEGLTALLGILGSSHVPQVVVSSLPLGELLEQADRQADLNRSADAGMRFERPTLNSEFVAPRDELERTLAEFWQELLGIGSVGVKDNFFDLGGHSLVAVRLFAKIKKKYGVEYPISVLFEAPNIERCAAMLREAATKGSDEMGAASATPSHRHLVDLSGAKPGKKTPFFLVAGMFGNVLNLRQLGHIIGADRRFYGLQARGLLGDHEPHECFEDMARDYLAEVRNVQPHGPYLIGGFSGGGLIAYEMAQQLVSAGEEVGVLALLDTPLPVRKSLEDLGDKLRMHLSRLRKERLAYAKEWAEDRYNWEMNRLRARFAPVAPLPSPAQFRSASISEAFGRSCERYVLKPYPGNVSLFRPKLDVAFVLANGQMVNHYREFISPDNDWTSWVARIEISEVPGNHDSMVLEPNVRILASELRNRIDAFEQRSRNQGAQAAKIAARANVMTESPPAAATSPLPPPAAISAAETSIRRGSSVPN